MIRPSIEQAATQHGAHTTAVRVVDFAPEHREYFERFNVEWLEAHFRVEAVDEAMFADPWGTILDPGGHIFMVYLSDRCVGTSALIQRKPGEFELAKMGVTQSARGQGVGGALVQACIARARAVQARRLYLATNSRLKTAIALYGRLGFEITRTGPDPIYERVDTVMTFTAPL